MRYRPSHPAVEVSLPPPGRPLPSAYAFSMHKAGSTLLNQILKDSCEACGVTYASLEDEFYRRGLVGPDRPKVIGAELPAVGYCFGGFRRYPHYDLPDLAAHRSAFLVRDPRDMLVSLYFSVAYSHEPPPSGGAAAERFHRHREKVRNLSPDEFAIRNVVQYARTIDGYYAQGFFRRPEITIYRYEDVIFRKRDWLADLVELFGWPLDDATIAAIAESHDERPSEERPDRHVRAVTPGNYRKHLTARAVGRINSALREYIRDLGYELD